MKKFLILLAAIIFSQHFTLISCDIYSAKIFCRFWQWIKREKNNHQDEQMNVSELSIKISDDVFIDNIKQLLKKTFPEDGRQKSGCDANINQLCEMITPHNVNIKDQDGKTILHLVVENRIKYLSWQQHSDIQSQKATLIKYLIRCRVDVNSRDRLGNTALHYAHYNSIISTDIIKRIIFRGANINARNDAGETPLITVTKAAFSYSAAWVKLYAAHGADVNVCDNNGENALLAMLTQENVRKASNSIGAEKSYAGFSDTIRELIEVGININAQNNDGNTALHKAVMFKDERTISCLGYDPMLDVNIKNKQGKTPLDIAIEQNWRRLNHKKSMIDLLMELGAKRGIELT